MKKKDDATWENEKREIQSLYQALMTDFSLADPAFDKLILGLDEHCRLIVWHQLNQAEEYMKRSVTNDDYSEILTVVHENLCKKQFYENYQKSTYPWFADYCIGLYRNKAKDYIEKQCRKQIREFSLEGSQEEDSPYYIPPVAVETNFELGELTAIEQILKLYTDAATNSKGNPFHIILFCYSKILAVILGETNCTSSDSWAWEKMDGKDMDRLSDDFIVLFNNVMYRIPARWGADYLAALEKLYTLKTGKTLPVAEVVPSEEFTQKMAKNWVARMHEHIIKAIMPAILQSEDDALVRMATNYTKRKYNL